MSLGKGLASLIPPGDDDKENDERAQINENIQAEEHVHPAPFNMDQERVDQEHGGQERLNQNVEQASQPRRVSYDAVFQIEVEKIQPNPYQPRRSVDKSGLEELAQSIREFGIIQPLIVSKAEKETEGGTSVEYQLIAGERRLQAAKLAGLERVPVIVRMLDFKKDKLTIALIENIQRADLNPIETARAYARLQDEFGFTQREVASRVSKSRESVANTLRLLSLPSHVQDAVSERKINESQARKLLSIKNLGEQDNAFERMIKKGVVRKSRRSEPHPDQTRESNFWEKQLEEKLAVPVKVIKRGGGGKVVMKFFSEDDWRELMDKLLGD